MAEQTRVHPAATTEGTVMAPAGDVKFIEIDYLAAVNGKTGPTSTIAAVTAMLGTFGTVVYAGPLYDSNTRQIFGIEGMTQDTINLGSATAIFGGPSSALQDVVA
jgi:hypothetical protein